MSHYATLFAKVRDAFPEMSMGEVRHACNKIGNYIRREHQDVYELYVSARPFKDMAGYLDFSTVEAGGQTVYFCLRVD